MGEERITIWLPGPPPTATAQQQKTAVIHGRIMKYDPPNVKAARAYFMEALAKEAPAAPLEGAIALYVQWQFPAGRHKERYKTTRPDTDNLQKLLKDCMTKAGYWNDDAQIADERALKVWSCEPGILIQVEVIE